MLKPLLALVFIAGVTLCAASSGRSLNQCVQHEVWVGHALEKMEVVKPGMTRNDLLKVFRTEGGLSTGLKRTYVSRECAYFKVDVEF